METGGRTPNASADRKMTFFAAGAEEMCIRDRNEAVLPLWKREGTASFFAHQTSGGGQQLSRGMSRCGTMILVARRFGFSMWLMVWLAASMPSW